jgi:uncharacterized protein with von Willebrand factor type A (vWA) domain
MSKSDRPQTLVSPAFVPMLDLFQRLRDAGMKLTLEQYDWLRQALAEGYGLADWEDLRDICRMLWVKPSLNYDAEVFEQVFDKYQQQYQQQFAQWLAQQKPEPEFQQPAPELPLGVLPQIPPRNYRRQLQPESQTETEQPSDYGMDAVKLEPPQIQQSQAEYVVQVPISRERVKRTWRMLQRPMPNPQLPELDIEATIERIGREGFFSEVVSRPIWQKKSELLLLVDDSHAMLPFAPVMQPLIQMVLERRISSAQIYRFSQCPTDYLYEWQRPLHRVPLAKVLGQLHRLRTVVMIVSEAGAASPLYSQERVRKTGKFLERLLPCVREVLWLNPMPQQRWAGTTAEPIHRALSSRMVPFEAWHWEQLAQSQKSKVGVQLWPLMQH